MAQLMRYYQYPTTGVGTASFAITIDDWPATRSLRGGDGAGGAYNWANMKLVPSTGTTLAQRQAIGAICHDAGVAAHMNYGWDASGAYMDDAAYALKNVFGFTNGVTGGDGINNIGSGLIAMINPNLDAGKPVLLGIGGAEGAHAIVCDGYGYDTGTLYHHLNLGWAGSEDAWYNLPSVVTSYYTFTSVFNCCYNLFTSGTGEIISGRVLASGSPVSGATVRVQKVGGSLYTATTNAKGIYAVACVPSNSQYQVSATATGYYWTAQTFSTGRSSDESVTSGNVWQADLTQAISHTAVTYYVNDASTASDEWCTAAGADASGRGLSAATPAASLAWILSTYDLEAGDVVRIDTGAYTLSSDVTVGSADGGIAGVPVTIIGSSKGFGAILDRASVTSGTACLNIQAPYIRLERLHINKGECGVRLGSSEATGFEMVNCIVTSGAYGLLADTSSVTGATLTNCTFWGATTACVGMASSSGAIASILNCIFSPASGYCIYRSAGSITASDTNCFDLSAGAKTGYWSGDRSTLSAWRSATSLDANSISADPLFVAASAGNFDLRSGSPCINTGSAPGAPSTDIHAQARPSGGGVDIGACERLDSDGDGLPDWYELWIINFATDAVDGYEDVTTSSDFDDDGSPDAAEYTRWTNPVSASSRAPATCLNWGPIASPQQVSTAFNVTISASDADGYTVKTYAGAVSLVALDPAAHLVCPSVTSPSTLVNPGTRGMRIRATSDMLVTHVRHCWGSKVSIWRDDGTLIATQNVASAEGTWLETALDAPVRLSSGARYRVAAYGTGTGYYKACAFPAAFSHGNVESGCFYTSGDAFPSSLTTNSIYLVDIRYQTISADAVTPPMAGAFTSGAWTGQVAVSAEYTGVRLLALGDFECAGASNAFNVTKKSQTITFGELAGVTYGGAGFVLTGTASSGLDVSYASSNTNVATVAGSMVTIVGAGTTTITASQGGNAEYAAAASVQRALVVAKAALAVTADNAERVYGDANPAFTGTLTGVVAGDGITATYASSAVAGTAVGVYGEGAGERIIPALNDPAGRLSNYDLTITCGTLTITKRRLTVTADDKTREYGQANPEFTMTYNGFAAGETAENLTTAPVAACAATADSLPGAYAIVPAGGVSGNYDFTYVNGTLTVTTATKSYALGRYALVGVPFVGGAATAEGLAILTSNCTGVWKWDANTQGWVSHPKGGPSNFPLAAGHAYLVACSASGTLELNGLWAAPAFALKSGYNLVTVPKAKSALTTAELVAQDIPNCTGLWKWDAAAQAWSGHAKGGPNNFAVSVGDALLVYITEDVTW